MIYDPLGRRIAKTEHDSKGYPLGETRFTGDGLRLWLEHRHQKSSLYEDEGYDPRPRLDGTGTLQKSATTTTTSTVYRNSQASTPLTTHSPPIKTKRDLPVEGIR